MAGNRHHRAEHQERDMFTAPSPDDDDSPYRKRPKAPPEKAPPEKVAAEEEPKTKPRHIAGSYLENPKAKQKRYDAIIKEMGG